MEELVELESVADAAATTASAAAAAVNAAGALADADATGGGGPDEIVITAAAGNSSILFFFLLPSSGALSPALPASSFRPILRRPPPSRSHSPWTLPVLPLFRLSPLLATVAPEAYPWLLPSPP